MDRPLTPRRCGELWLSTLAPATRRVYLSALNGLMLHVGERNLPALIRRMTKRKPGSVRADVLSWLAKLDEQGVSAACYNQRLHAFLSLTRHLNHVGKISWLIALPKRPAHAFRDATGPRSEEVKRLFEVADGDDALERRDVLALHLLFTLALRRFEALSIRVEDVDLPRKRVCFLAKGWNAERCEAGMPDCVADAIKRWLEVRGVAAGPLLRPVIQGAGNVWRVCDRPLSDRGLHTRIRRLGQKAGIQLRPHGLRHAAGTQFQALVGDVHQTQLLLRHRNISTTQSYLDAAADAHGAAANRLANDLFPRASSNEG